MHPARDVSTHIAPDVSDFHPSLLPPWTLHGSALVMLTRLSPPQRKQSLLPFGVRALVHYEYSPVGAYEEMAVAVLSKHGPTVVQMPVTLEASMIGGRANWGFPKTLLPMSWRKRGNRIEFRTPNKRYRARAFGLSFPLKLRIASTQILNNECVRVPVELEGRARFAFCGKQLAVFIENFEMIVEAPI